MTVTAPLPVTEEGRSARIRRLPSTSTDFRAVVEHLYFRGQSALDTLLHVIRQYHLGGPEYAGDSGPLLELITRRLTLNRESQDLRNGLSVIMADLIARDGRDGSGRLAPEVLGARWGGAAGDLLDRLVRVGSVDGYRDRRDDPTTRNELVRFVALFAPEQLGAFLAAEPIPVGLPLVNFARELAGEPDSSVAALVLVQHLFGSTVPLVQALAGDRVPPAGVFILGKPYSTNQATMWRLRELGYTVHPGSSEYSGIGEYHEEADRHITSLLLRCLRWLESSGTAPGRRVLLVDDGGRAIRLLHTPLFEDVACRFVCVEQTRRGIRELDEVSLRMPVANVAESRLKLEEESRLIAASVRRELTGRLADLNAAGVDYGRALLVLGFGAIGQAVASAMTEAGFHVTVFDPDPARGAVAGRAGFRVAPDLAGSLPQADVIIGCSGQPVLDYPEYARLKDGVVLASASSSDIEFRAWQLRGLALSFSATHRFVDEFNLVHERFRDRLLYLGDLDHPCHFLALVRYQGKQFFLLNGGFPINMNGTVDPIAPTEIQLTRALLYVGAVEASRATVPGLLPVSESAQRRLLARYQALNPTAGGD